MCITFKFNFFKGSLKVKINLFLYLFDVTSSLVMQIYLEWNKLQFKRSQTQNLIIQNQSDLVKLRTGLISLLSVTSFIVLLISNLFLTGKRMGHQYYIVEFFVSGLIFFLVVPLVFILKNSNISSYVKQKFFNKVLFITKANNQVCPRIEIAWFQRSSWHLGTSKAETPQKSKNNLSECDNSHTTIRNTRSKTSIWWMSYKGVLQCFFIGKQVGTGQT